MQYALIYPMAAMVLLTTLVLMRMVMGRVAAVRRGDVDARFYKTYQGEGAEPRKEAQNTRHFINLFESPVLFYAACIAAMVAGQGSGAMVWLAWAYVICRVLHAVVHLGSNRIPPRMAIYGASWLVLLVMWGALVVRVAQSPV
jgi:hypothetical protein